MFQNFNQFLPSKEHTSADPECDSEPEQTSDSDEDFVPHSSDDITSDDSLSSQNSDDSLSSQNRVGLKKEVSSLKHTRKSLDSVARQDLCGEVENRDVGDDDDVDDDNDNDDDRDNDDNNNNVDDHSQPSNAIHVSRKDCTVSYFDKRPYCMFCGKQQTQIQRHWLAVHSEEHEVVQIGQLKDRNERCKHITRLRNLGNHLHNMEVVREQKGELMVTYRAGRRHRASALDYVPCEHCFAYLMKSELHRHRCRLQNMKVKGRVAANASLLLPPPHGTSTQVFELLNGMSNDTIVKAARTDSLIIDYAAKLLARKGMTKKAYVRDKVREVARFLLQMRQQSDMRNISLTDCIKPERFKQCVVAVKALAGFNVETMAYTRPSLALKIGHALQKLATIVKRNAIEQKDDAAIKTAEYFSEVCSMEWSDEVAVHALGTLQENKRNTVKLLPLSSDVVRLSTYIKETSASVAENLAQSSGHGEAVNTEKAWRHLAELTLADVITFNRRRQGEVSKMSVEDYARKTMISMSSDAIEALSPLEQNLCKFFVRVELKGKRDRTVPVLLLPRVQTSIDLLLTHRVSAGIRPSNSYVFAYSSSENHLRGCDALRNAATACGAESPSTLTSTNFRKHVATLSQILNLKNNELDLLAQYMGHDVRVHREFYRLPNDVLQTSKLAKLFLLMESGQLASQKGKSLDELMLGICDSNGDIGKCNNLS